MPALANPKRELFAQQVAAGTPAGRAYAELYGNRKTPDAAASRLLKIVKPRVAEIQRKLEDSTLLTMQRRREIAREIAEDRAAKAADRIRAVELDAKLSGELIEKREHSGNIDTNVSRPLTAEKRSE